MDFKRRSFQLAWSFAILSLTPPGLAAEAAKRSRTTCPRIYGRPPFVRVESPEETVARAFSEIQHSDLSVAGNQMDVVRKMVVKLRSYYRNATPEVFRRQMENWSKDHIAHHGYFPGLAGKPGEPTTFTELEGLFSREPGQLPNIYGNNISALNMFSMLMSGMGKPMGTEPSQIRSRLGYFQTGLLWHEYASRQIKSGKASPRMAEIHETIERQIQEDFYQVP